MVRLLLPMAERGRGSTRTSNAEARPFDQNTYKAFLVVSAGEAYNLSYTI